MIYLTRRERFNAAHRLYRSDWTDEKNSEVYGKCANPNWHGHNYILFVTVKGDIKPELGYVVDLKTLSKKVLIQQTVKLIVSYKIILSPVFFARTHLTRGI